MESCDGYDSGSNIDFSRMAGSFLSSGLVFSTRFFLLFGSDAEILPQIIGVYAANLRHRSFDFLRQRHTVVWSLSFGVGGPFDPWFGSSYRKTDKDTAVKKQLEISAS